MKLLQACLRVRKELECSFHHCGGPVRTVYIRERPEKAVFTAKELLRRACRPLKVPGTLVRAVFTTVEDL